LGTPGQARLAIGNELWRDRKLPPGLGVRAFSGTVVVEFGSVVLLDEAVTRRPDIR